MNEYIRYPLMLLIATFIGGAFVLPAYASPSKATHYFQPNLAPASATGYRVDFNHRYRFRPIAGYGANHHFRSPPVRYFGGYYGAVIPQPYAYPPGFRPARFYHSGFSDRNPSESTSFAFPQTGYFRPRYFSNPANSPQWEWRTPSMPVIRSPIIEHGFYLPGTPAFAHLRSGEQWRYSGRFRPLPINRYAPPRLVAYNWGHRLPTSQMPVRWLPVAQFFPPWPHQSPASLAYFASVNTASQKMAGSRRFPGFPIIGSAPINYQIANSRNPIRFSSSSEITNAVASAFRHYEYSLSTPYPGYFMPAYRQYRFRPDSRIAVQDAGSVMVGRRGFFDDSLDYGERYPSASFKFRPDSRFGSLPTIPRRGQPVFAASPDHEALHYLTDDLQRLSANGMWSFRTEFKDTADSADTPETSVLDPMRSIDSYRFRSMADNTAG